MQIIGTLFKGIISLVMIAAVLLAGVFIYSFMGRAFANVGPAAPAQTQAVTFEVKSGETVSQIADNLQAAGIIDSAFAFKWQLKLSGHETDMKAGKFELATKMDSNKVISILSAPVAAVPVLKFQVIEGWRLEQIAEELDAQGVLSATHFLDLAATPDGVAQFSDDFLQSAQRPEGASLEGYLFPDTYEVKKSPGDNSKAVIQIMYDTMEERITPEMRQTLAAKGRTVHQMLTIASIVQREGVVAEELPEIASVFWNRVDRETLLNADPTTQYALGKPGDWWPQLNLDPNTVDSPYNTYRVVGLPPGPICNPGLKAIEAAVSPAETDYLYFVAKNDGSHTHAFAKTLEEHERNRVKYGNR